MYILAEKELGIARLLERVFMYTHAYTAHFYINSIT